MRCYELREKLYPGILCHYPFVFLGHPGETGMASGMAHHLRDEHPEVLVGNIDETLSREECVMCHHFRWNGWNRPPVDTDEPHKVLTLGDDMRDWICAELHCAIAQGELIVLTHARLTDDLRFGRANMVDDGRGRKRDVDDHALLLVANGGRVTVGNHRARIAIDAGDTLVLLRPGGLIRVTRDGELEGARREFALGWDGSWMHELHIPNRPARGRVSMMVKKAAETPVRRLVEQAPPPRKVMLTDAEVTALIPGLPAGAKRVTVDDIECIVWDRGDNDWAVADLHSKLRRKSGIRVGGASSYDEAVELLKAEITPTTSAS